MMAMGQPARDPADSMRTRATSTHAAYARTRARTNLPIKSAQLERTRGSSPYDQFAFGRQCSAVLVQCVNRFFSIRVCLTVRENHKRIEWGGRRRADRVSDAWMVALQCGLGDIVARNSI